jgi:hypothetical protein
MPLHDATAEPQPYPCPPLSAGAEGLEEVITIDHRQAYTRIPKGNRNPLVHKPHGDMEIATIRYGLARIDSKVDENLLEQLPSP